ncbi:MAG: undecaprenyldiphospho-muramoylpentapeptide beta-N-acetylglucosaminyltransferase [Bacteroidia bacterium]|nr:MAG: undecaprenyldiphospho-muramoylpentapeptide beta-N-acetylglucosaminyltransferase [Bacteroidia bacterium]
MRASGSSYRFIISGGGTGGHIFPAIAIANALVAEHPGCELLFVGAEGRMEMTRVPEAGYRIEGLPMVGMPRSRNPLAMLRFLLAWARSNRRARRIIRDFGPDLVIGVGGYSSAPTLGEAQKLGVPTLIQEQNGYAGRANRLLARRARAVSVAYEGMERFFPSEKVVLTGNPVRQVLAGGLPTRDAARAELGLPPRQRVLLIVGGSLGASTLNAAITDQLPLLAEHPETTVCLQTGARSYEAVRERVATYPGDNLRVLDFIGRMDLYYAAADLIVSRAGAIAISELCIVGKPLILVPSPNVAEDHQTRNAETLSTRGAARLIPDHQAREQLLPQALELLQRPQECQAMAERIRPLARPHADRDIVRIINQILGEE